MELVLLRQLRSSPEYDKREPKGVWKLAGLSKLFMLDEESTVYFVEHHGLIVDQEQGQHASPVKPFMFQTSKAMRISISFGIFLSTLIQRNPQQLRRGDDEI